MPHMAERMGEFESSKIVAIANKANAMKEQGLDVVSFSIGVPNFDPPKHVFDAAKQAAEDGVGRTYLPSKGMPQLINAFIERQKQDGFEWEVDEVCATMGGKSAIFMLFNALINEDEEVIIPTPFWSSYTGILRYAGKGEPVLVRCPAEQEYKITPEQLQAAITPKTKAFLFNNPSNPTGMTYTKEEVKALGDVLEKHPDIWIISDDIYDKLIYDGETFNHLLHTNPNLKGRVFTCQSVSKNYGMPGWRVGFACGPKEVIQMLPKVVSQTYMNIPGVAQLAAAAAFSGDHGFLEPLKAEFVKKRDKTLAVLDEIPGVFCPKPKGAFYVFPDVKAYFGTTWRGHTIDNDETLCKLLLDELHLALIPGSYFGEPNSIRISYANTHEALDEGLKRLKNFFAEVEGDIRQTA